MASQYQLILAHPTSKLSPHQGWMTSLQPLSMATSKQEVPCRLKLIEADEKARNLLDITPKMWIAQTQAGARAMSKPFIHVACRIPSLKAWKISKPLYKPLHTQSWIMDKRSELVTSESALRQEAAFFLLLRKMLLWLDGVSHPE